MNEISIWVIITWIISLTTIVTITYKAIKESKQSDDYFHRDKHIIDDFYTRKD